jgi:L-lactate dehydrogenase complex protein LldG
MTPDGRAEMRDAIGRAVRQARLPDAELTHPGVYQPRAAAPYDLVERFRAELTTLGGMVHEASHTGDVVAIVRKLVELEREPRVLLWDEASLPVRGLASMLRSSGIEILTQTPDTARSADDRRALATAAVGVTGADAGLAETGSIVLASGPGRGRLASLLPPLHVALLRRTELVASLFELVTRRPELVTAGANFVCITGPSRTADIEHTLSRGVHGPKEVHVVLI